MAKIYISSTYEDLKKEREAAAQAVRRLGHQAIDMEDYVATPSSPIEKCLQDVKKCDAYLGIFAWSYGDIPDGYDKSFTHLEYETAKKARIPCLVFLTDQKAKWPVEYVTTGEERIKIDQLRSELKKEYIVSFFKNADELSGLVSAAVSNLVLIAERSFIKFRRLEELIGTQLGKYVIQEKLGRGGKGVVFKVMDTLEEREKAIKMVPPSIADSPVAFRELKQEVNTAACIIHPNVVKVLGLEEYEGQFFIVMEYIEGKSLEQILVDSKDGKLEESEVIEIMKKLSRGLLETHKKNVIHRDIKPSNLMITSEGQVKILDFGISYQVTTSMTELMGEHHRSGTWPYMAPEQLSNRYGRENKQVDIWGFGVTMYQLLAGELPFKNKDQIKDKHEKPYELEGVSRKTRNIVMKCLEKDRKKRFQNMEEVWNAISKRKTPRWKCSLATISIIVLIVLASFLIPPLLQRDKPDVKQKTVERLEEYKKYLNQAERHFKNGDLKKAREQLNLAIKIQKTTETGNLEKKIKELENKEKEFAEYYTAAKKCFDKGNYDKALEYISKAEVIKNTAPLIELKSKVQAAIEEKKKKDLKQRDELAYKKASAQNTIASYQEYLRKYPSGRYAKEAKDKIKKLEQMPEDVKFVASKESKGIKVYKNKKGLWEADYGYDIIMVYIEPGKFTMGSDEGDDDEKKPHKVDLAGYWIGKTEVTKKQFNLFVKDKNYVTDAESSGGAYIRIGGEWQKKKDINWKNPGFKQEDNHPVVCVSWNDAVAYCKWLSGKKDVNFKLPTEAQWEKSARGTDQRKYPWEDNVLSGKKANFADKQALLIAKINKGNKYINDGYVYTAPVGLYLAGASPYGLLDMAGNVWEWCSDWYDSDYYKNSPKKNPTGPDSGNGRVMRGGSWFDEAETLRCTNRSGKHPSLRNYNVGFRLCQDNK